MKGPKGPELSMPDVKVPPVLADVYFDLRDRRLLPLIALVVAAIVAVPFLLGEEPEPPPLPEVSAAAGDPEGAAAKASTLTVVEANPGLRDYTKRLRGRTATDPFIQRSTGLPAGARLVGGSSSGSAAEGSSGSSAAGPSTGSGGALDEVPVGGGDGTAAEAQEPSAQSGGDAAGEPEVTEGDKRPRLFELVVDVQISRTQATADGGRKMGEPQVRRRVPPLTPLPGEKQAVVTTMGVNLRNGKVVLMVSAGVTSISGEYACVARVARAEICELLEVEPGFPLDLIYGPGEVLYRIKATKVDAVWAGRVGGPRSSRGALTGPHPELALKGAGSRTEVRERPAAALPPRQ